MKKKRKSKSFKPQKMKAYGSFKEWKEDQSAIHQILISKLVRLVKKAAPSLVPIVKWGQGCWTLNDSPKIYIHAEPDHLHFGFFSGSTLSDPEEQLFGNGKHVRHLKVFSAKDISSKNFVGFIKQAIGSK